MWLLAIWAAGTLVLFCRILGGRIAAGWFRRNCAQLGDSQLFNRVNVLRRRFAIQRPVRVLASPRVVSPIVLSGWRPALVLPENFAQDFNREQQDTILAHELAHLAAREGRQLSESETDVARARFVRGVLAAEVGSEG